MATVTIVTSGVEISFNGERYEALAGDLRSRGISVTIDSPPEQRGGLPEAFQIAVYVNDVAAMGITVAELAGSSKLGSAAGA